MFKRFITPLLCMTAALLSIGCSTVCGPPPSAVAKAQEHQTNFPAQVEAQVTELSETTVPPPPLTAVVNSAPPRPKPRRIQKWNPIWLIGNHDDPVPPDWYRPGKRFRKVRWGLRNPFHNFTFYVIGVGDKDFHRTGTHPKHVFNPDGGWTRATTRLKCWRLPFVSYMRGDFKFYFGWRERGNFGIKLTF